MYRVGLVIVAVAMLLLPLLYLALIGATGALVWWHVTENTWILDGSGVQWRFLAYATPAVAGGVLVFFMVKPILARPSASRDPVPIDAHGEPVLFGLVEEICRQVRSPRPRRVCVDCAVNASAAFVPGPLRLLRRDLVLTVGLPLVAGLSIREFAGVLAHEFGHFAQGGGMRLTAIVRGVNAWFARVVYERDEWDVKLERWSRETDWRLAIVLVFARGAVWVSRRILAGLMIGGHAISCFMMRQMEYDADSYEVQIAGSDAFVRTSNRLRELNLAAHLAYQDVSEGLRRDELPVNLPAFMVERGRRVPAELLAHVRAGHDGKTGVFDTHPSDGDRIRAAAAAASRGVLVGADGPAVLLFRDFDTLSAAATRHHFEHDLGLDVATLALIDTDAAVRESRTREENLTAIRRFFGECFSPWRPLRLPAYEAAPPGADELGAESAAAREAMATAGAKAATAYAEFDALETKHQQAFAANQLLIAGFTAVDAADFGLAEGTEQAAIAAAEGAVARQQALAPALEAFEAAAIRRLSCADLLHGAGGSPDPSHEAGALINVVNAIGGVIPDVRELRRLAGAALVVEQNAPSSPDAGRTAAQLRLLEGMIVNRRKRIRGSLAAVACLSGFASSTMTLADRCGFGSDRYASSASEAVDRTVRLYIEVTGRLAAIALQQEASAGTSGTRGRTAQRSSPPT
jgi:Zn-dependent protease with chaperone function